MQTRSFVALALALIVGTSGCDSPPTVEFDAGPDPLPFDAGSCTGDFRLSRSVYYGTPEPTALPMSPGQTYAVVSFGGCSGAFITDEWVLTARHCGIRPGRQLCTGTNPTNPNICFTAAETHAHPDADMALVRVDTPASVAFPELVPVQIMTEEIDTSWFGVIAEASGYGTQEDGSSGEREFTAEPIFGFEGPFVAINGEGVRGVCFGDSGGPLFVLASDSTIRVLGDLSFGDPSCLGIDRYTRVDLLVDWVEQFTGPTVVSGGPCGAFTPTGDCMGSTAIWCEADTLTSERCEGAATCGWEGASGFRCITTPDPCEGVSATGECVGQIATWCDAGEIRRRDCASCDEVCGPVSEVGGIYCQPDPCDGIGFQGECQGETALWCDMGVVNMRDCAADGLRCGYINDRIGYFCGR